MQALKTKVIELLRSTHHSKSPEAEAEQILFHVARMSNQRIRKPSDLSTQEVPFGPGQTNEVLQIAENRAKGVPLQHLLGYQFFYSREYSVNSSTLVPRPETEVLVDEAIRFLRTRHTRADFRFAELGIGTAVISCEILSHFPQSKGIASDVCLDSIELAKKNLKEHLGPEYTSRIDILHSPSSTTGFEIFQPFAPFDLIVSNPPYLSPEDEIDNEVSVFEPASALFPLTNGKPSNPLHFYESLVDQAPRLLCPGGAIFLEIPHERAEIILKLFPKGEFEEISLIPDLTGRNRLLFATRAKTQGE